MDMILHWKFLKRNSIYLYSLSRNRPLIKRKRIQLNGIPSLNNRSKRIDYFLKLKMNKSHLDRSNDLISNENAKTLPFKFLERSIRCFSSNNPYR